MKKRKIIRKRKGDALEKGRRKNQEMEEKQETRERGRINKR